MNRTARRGRNFLFAALGVILLSGLSGCVCGGYGWGHGHGHGGWGGGHHGGGGGGGHCR